MSICTLFSHRSNLSHLPEELEKLYGPGSVELEGEADNWTQLTVTKRKVLRKVELVLTRKQRGGELDSMLAKLKHVVGAIPAQNEDVRKNLMLQIDHLNSALEVEAKTKLAGGEDVIFAVAKQMEGLIFYEGNKILNKKGVLVLDFKGRVHVPEFEVHTEGEEPIAVEDNGDDEAQERKARTEMYLEEMKIPMNIHLPFIRSSKNVTLRSLEEVIWRVLCLNLVALKGEGLPMDTVKRIVVDHKLKPHFSPNEVDFVRVAETEESDRIQFAWRYESLFTLLWALGFTDELGYPGHICDVQAVVKLIYDSGGFTGLAESANLRSKEEILDELDRIYRLHWAVVDARLRDEPAPVGLEAGVVYERHYALNWLTGYQNADWDEVPTET